MAEIYCEVSDEIDEKSKGKSIGEQNRIMAENRKRLENSIGWIDYLSQDTDNPIVTEGDGCYFEAKDQDHAVIMSELLQIKALLRKKKK